MKKCKGWWICKKCDNFFEFIDADEIEEDEEGNIWPICPECGETVNQRYEPTEPKDYIEIGGMTQFHIVGDVKCCFCEYGYPISCKCGGLVHKGHDHVKCDKCGKVTE